MTPGLIHDYIGGTQKNKGETIKRDEKKEKYKESHFGKCRANCLLVIRKVPIHLPLADPLKKLSVYVHECSRGETSAKECNGIPLVRTGLMASVWEQDLANTSVVLNNFVEVDTSRTRVRLAVGQCLWLDLENN